MTNHFTFSIDEVTGDVRFLVSDMSQSFVNDSSTVKRASHIEPYNFILRTVFKVIRFLWNDESKAAKFTRSWKCKWRVNLSPVGGPVISEFTNRDTAIEFEVQWLENNWL